jgi:SAM-dependent methyltransferase
VEHIAETLDRLERDPRVCDRARAVDGLRALGLGDFAVVLWSMPDPKYPKLSGLLPAMAPEAVQRTWTGHAGQPLLVQSTSFMRSISANYAQLTGSGLAGRSILDFGCGFGRFVRLGLYFTDSVFGVDPWDQSIERCREAGLGEHVARSAYLPDRLPAPEHNDLIVAFSVFTHLSRRATEACLVALRRHTRAGGIAAITVRPVEFWRSVRRTRTEAWLAEMERGHRSDGFAFAPHAARPEAGEVTYGDTSMRLEWLATLCAGIGWRIAALDRNVDYPLQRFVFLQAV